MGDLGVVLTVVGMFVIRVGIPLVMLIILGLMIDRWQTRRNEEVKRIMKERGLDMSNIEKKAEAKKSTDKAA